jgi:hypothetical protein
MRIAALTAVALLVPAAVAAADPEPSAPPPARWSIGAGVGGVLFGDPIVFPGESPSSGVPFVQASLERRIGRATWLVLGVNGSYEDSEADPFEGTGTGATIILLGSALESDGWRGRVAAGLRRELTGAAAPFVVSGVLLATVGGISVERTFLAGSPAAEVREEGNGVVAGLSAGVAVDRELTRGLSVRISSQLLTTDWSWSEITSPGVPTREFRAFRAGVTLAPVLELRLAF